MAIYGDGKHNENMEYKSPNYYIDIDGKDRSQQVEDAFVPTLEDIQNDPQFYAELVNDLMYHWMYGTRETPLMVMAKRNHKIGVEGKIL